MLAVFIMKCLSISTTYHFQSEHIRPHPRFTPLCGHLVRCHMLFVVNVFLRLTPPLSPELSHFSPLINQVAETKHPKFTSMPRTCFVSGGCSGHALLKVCISVLLMGYVWMASRRTKMRTRRWQGDVNVGWLLLTDGRKKQKVLLRSSSCTSKTQKS